MTIKTTGKPDADALKKKQAKDDIAANASIQKHLENVERLLGLRE